jgi:hypothetical protein
MFKIEVAVSLGYPLSAALIHKLSGIIRTNALLDREDVNEYFLTIAIEDSVNNQTNYHKLVQVIIEDINDNTPIFLGINGTFQ